MHNEHNVFLRKFCGKCQILSQVYKWGQISVETFMYKQRFEGETQTENVAC